MREGRKERSNLTASRGPGKENSYQSHLDQTSFKMAAVGMACSRMCFSSSFGARFALSSIRVNQGMI